MYNNKRTLKIVIWVKVLLPCLVLRVYERGCVLRNSSFFYKSVLLLPKMSIDRTIFVLFFFRLTCTEYLHMGSLFIYCTSLLYFTLLTCIPSIRTLQVSPVHSPPYRQPLDLKPITQELITEDGQRISVDVNLRLISPPVGAETEMAGYGRQPPANHRQTGLQYPVESMSNGQVCLVD